MSSAMLMVTSGLIFGESFSSLTTLPSCRRWRKKGGGSKGGMEMRVKRTMCGREKGK